MPLLGRAERVCLHYRTMVPIGLFVAGVVCIAASVLTGEAEVSLFLIFPVFSGVSGLFLLGTLLIVLSFIAGLMSPLALFIAATGGRGWTLTLLPFLLVLVGVILALGMYFAWLTPTPEEMRGDEFERDPPREIPEVAGRVS